jgi:hypothetical protein
MGTQKVNEHVVTWKYNWKASNDEGNTSSEQRQGNLSMPHCCNSNCHINL